MATLPLFPCRGARFVIEAWTQTSMFAMATEDPREALRNCRHLKSVGFLHIIIYDEENFFHTIEQLESFYSEQQPF